MILRKKKLGDTHTWYLYYHWDRNEIWSRYVQKNIWTYRRADNQAYPALTNIVGLYWLFLWEMFTIIVHTYTLMPIYPVTADLVENCCWNVWRTGSIQEDNIL